MRGIQYAAALSINHRRLWDTGSPAGACHRAALCADPLAGDDRSEEGVGVARFRFSFQTARIQTAFEIVIAGLKSLFRRMMDARIKSRHDKRIPAARCVRVMQYPFAARKQRAQGMPGARCTRSLVCEV
jgi:hypothetical protein